MFVLSTVQDTLFIPASSFTPTSTSTQPPTSAHSLSLALNSKYANRVIPDVGLCVCLFDILEVSEGKVKWGDGGLWHKLKARLVVFRPFVGEVLVGKVKSSDERGIKVTLGFFDDIHIPKHLMPEPSAFDHSERAWFWLFPSDDDDDDNDANRRSREDPLSAPSDQRMYLDKDESIRFMVEDDVFDEGLPIPGLAATGGPAGGGTGIGTGVTVEIMQAAKAKRKAPFQITASIANQGLGLVRWWSEASADRMEEQELFMEE